MNKWTVSFLMAMILFVVIAITWSKTGGFAQAYQEQNAKAWADNNPKFAQTSDCKACHSKVYNLWVDAKHKTVNCQNCHGPAAKHIEGEGKPVIDTSREACGYCHSKITGRRADFPTVDLEKHNPGLSSCILCHNNHAPVAPRTGGN